MTDLVRSSGNLPAMTAEEERASVDNPRREIITGLIIIALFFGGFFTWAAFAPLDAAAVASGVVQVSGNSKAVQHQHGGTVDQILVSNGDRVSRGDLLLKLDTRELVGTKEQLQSRLITLRARKARLLAEQDARDVVEPGPWLSSLTGAAAEDAKAALASEQDQLDTRAESLTGQIKVLGQRKAQLQQRIQGFQAQLRANEAQRGLLEEQLDAVQQLYEKGLSPLTKVRQYQSQIVSLQGDKGRINASVAEARESMGEVDSQISSLQDEINTDVTMRLSDTQREIAEVQPQYDTIALRIERAEVRAPVSGVVVGNTVFTEGGVIAPGQVLMEIVPQEEPLVIRAQIDPAKADDVEIGMEAEVRLQIGRSRENPILYGTIERLSADRIVDERSGVSYFETEIVVPPSEIHRMEQFLERDIVLRPGYPAQVVIPLRPRTMLGYLSEPITGALWQAGREN